MLHNLYDTHHGDADTCRLTAKGTPIYTCPPPSTGDAVGSTALISTSPTLREDCSVISRRYFVSRV